MFGKKKEAKRAPKSANQTNNSMDFLINPVGDDNDEDDEELEAELLRLTTGEDIRVRPKGNVPPKRRKPAEIIIPKDIASDEEDDEDVDENDPELLSELKAIISDDEEPEVDAMSESEQNNQASVPVSNETVELLKQRLQMYEAAETKAKSENETSKARRYLRGIKTLRQLLHTAQSGNEIDESAIPPILPPSALPNDASIEIEEPPPAPEFIRKEPSPIPEPSEQSPSEEPPAVTPSIDQESLELLKKRQQEYRIAAVKWKKHGDVEQALNHVKIAKQFDIVIAALTAGETVDLSDMPPTPQLPGAITTAEQPSETIESKKEENDTQEASAVEQTSPVTGEDIGGALKERLEIYRRTKTEAEEQGNSSKARRYGRICKQYEDAIKLHAKGKSFAVDELPIPPGFPPIILNVPAPGPRPVGPPPPGASRPAPSPPKAVSVQPVPRKPMTHPTTKADKQIQLLERRQAELKRAALAAKKEGDLELARDYLRKAKGIDPLINASRAGLPVDMKSIPLSPNAKTQLDASSDESFTLVSSEECKPIDENSTDQEIYDNLEATLIKHKKVCLSTRDHAKTLGDVPGFNRWERMAVDYARDLDMLRVRRRDGLPPPQHHYEVKTYAIVQSCTDLSDNDIEIAILRGINYPKEADTYVIYEFPYPNDNPSTDRTSTIRNTNDPEYDATFTIEGIIDRSVKQCQRAFKRHALKCQVWSKGEALNRLEYCLQMLDESPAVLHSPKLMNGRKAVGGKLEVRIRLRNPISTKQIEKMTDKWLTIDN